MDLSRFPRLRLGHFRLLVKRDDYIGLAAGGNKTRNPAAVDRLVNECFAGADYKEDRRAFMTKRTPVFLGR